MTDNHAKQALCHVSDVAEGDAKGFPIDGDPKRKVIVLRVNGDLIGWRDSCPHYAGGTPMAWRTNAYQNADQTMIVCASHGATFDKKTGACTLGPCLGKSLTAVPLRIDADGQVFVDATKTNTIQGEYQNGE